jgi:hypothetical protein
MRSLDQRSLPVHAVRGVRLSALRVCTGVAGQPGPRRVHFEPAWNAPLGTYLCSGVSVTLLGRRYGVPRRACGTLGRCGRGRSGVAVGVGVELRALGPVGAVVNGGLVELGPPKQRALFGLLVSRVGRPVAVDVLLEELWSGDPPAAAMASLLAMCATCGGCWSRTGHLGRRPRCCAPAPRATC